MNNTIYEDLQEVLKTAGIKKREDRFFLDWDLYIDMKIRLIELGCEIGTDRTWRGGAASIVLFKRGSISVNTKLQWFKSQNAMDQAQKEEKKWLAENER